MDQGSSVGQLVAYWRRKRKMSQAQLANQVGYSTSWLTKIERGERVMDSITALLLLARVLEVGPWELMPTLGLPPNGGDPLDPPGGIYAISHAVMTPLLPDRAPPDPDLLSAALEEAEQENYLHARLESTARLLPDLIFGARAAADAGLPGGWRCLASAYRLATSLARQFGKEVLAVVAAQREVEAARRCGDPLLVASAQRQVAFSLLQQGWVDDAGAVCSDAADAIAPAGATPQEGWSLWGSLHLTGAVAAARVRDRSLAYRLLRDARTAAAVVGAGRDDYWEAFGPANVGVHEVAVALEAGDPIHALQLANDVDLDEFEVQRRPASFMIDVARAHSLRRDDAAAVLALLEAERYAPDMVRYSVKAREVVGVSLRREKTRNPALRRLARRLDVSV